MSLDADSITRPPVPAAGDPAARTAASPRARALLRRVAGDRAHDRVFRALAFGFLPAGVLFGLLAGPGAAGQADRWPVWWSEAAFLLGVAPSVVLGACAFLLPIPVLKTIARIGVAGVLVVLASIPFAALPSPAWNEQAWFLQVCGLGLIATALAMRPGTAVLTQLLAALLIVVDRQSTDHSDALLEGLQDGLYVLLFSSTFVALGVGARIAGRAADREEAQAVASAGVAAADTAREGERARVNALVHDRVLATLLSAARHVPGSASLERTDARRALEGLHALLRDEIPNEDLAGQDFAWQVQAVTTDLAPEAGFGYDVLEPRLLPGEAVQAMLRATEEALRNSLRHAGDANRTVHVRVDGGGVQVDVLDDGVGFDRSTVPEARLGIAHSIEQRMRSVPGGGADVITRPGVGTRVVLRWLAP